MSIATLIANLQADEQKAIAFCKTELVHLKDEGAIILAWVEKEVPGSAGAVAVFLQLAEAEAADLAKHAGNGLSTQISAGGDEMQTLLMNFINASGFDVNVKGGLKALDASAVALLVSIFRGLVSTGLASILAKLGAAAIAAV